MTSWGTRRTTAFFIISDTDTTYNFIVALTFSLERLMHSIKHNCLEAAILFAIQYQVNTAVSYSELIARINSAPLKKVNPTALTTR